MKNCQKYTYLGVIFNQDGKLTTAVKDHVLSKQPQLLKFAAFVRKNTDAHYLYSVIKDGDTNFCKIQLNIGQ